MSNQCNTPLPEPDGLMHYVHPDGRRPSAWSEAQVYAHAAAVSAADNAALQKEVDLADAMYKLVVLERNKAEQENASLRAELAKHQESEFHTDWSMLSATRDSLAEHQQIIRDQRERVRVLEDALQWIVRVAAMEYEYKRVARAALGDRNG